MFEEFRARHPIVYWVLLIGGGLILFFAIVPRLFGGGRSTASTVTTIQGPSDAQVAASASLEIARINATADAAARDDMLELQLGALGVQYRMAELEHARGMNADNLSYWLGVRQLDKQTEQVGIAADLERALAQFDADTERAEIEAWRDTQLAMTDAQVQMNFQNNKTARKRSGGLFGSLFGGLFSDVRLKSDLVYLFTDPKTGLSWYEFNYTPEARQKFGLPAGRRVGVLAQDLLDTVHAKHVTRDASGYLRVNYSAINGAQHGRLALA